jgi:putative selenate reductase
LPGDLRRRIEHVAVPDELFDCVTLSTFHGCPADEIERIAVHLLDEHGAHVVVKMNPTLLGREDVDGLLRGTLGYDELTVHRPAFDGDLTFDQAVAMMGRLEAIASARGLSVGAKFTNTLVVENHKSFFPDQKQMYLSGPPLHVLAMHAAARFAEATAGRFQLSFSGGIDRHNFTDALACGLVPVTTCTDLLRPGGYARLPKYMKELEAAMSAAGVRSIDAGGSGGEDASAAGTDLRAAALANLRAYAAKVALDPRYAAPKNRKVPRRVGTHLALLDCVTCDKCVQVCPNDANFAIDVPAGTHEGKNVVLRGGAVVVEDAPVFVVKRDRQFANFVDFCNDCGNCDVFCPEEGGPYKVKPRFFGAQAGFEAGQGDGFFVDRDALGRSVMWGRIDGVTHHLVLDHVTGRAAFTDGAIACGIDLATGQVLDAALSTRPAPATPADGHTLPLWRYHAMRILLDGTLAGVNPVSARWLDPSARQEAGPGGGTRPRLPLAAAPRG